MTGGLLGSLYITFVLYAFIRKPMVLARSFNLELFCCMCVLVCDGRAMSSANSKSSSTENNDHMIPVCVHPSSRQNSNLSSACSKCSNSSPRMPIVLRAFTSSSRTFVDLSYRALLFIDAKKELNSFVAMNAR